MISIILIYYWVESGNKNFYDKNNFEKFQIRKNSNASYVRSCEYWKKFGFPSGYYLVDKKPHEKSM